MSETVPTPTIRFQALSLFCDDVRLELGGKVSLIGVYGPTLIAGHADRPLPKLVAFVSLIYPIEAVGANVSVRVTEDGKPVVETQVPLLKPGPVAQVRADQPAQNAGLLGMPIEIQGYVPRHGARLQVHLAVDGFGFEGPVLHMIAPDAPSAAVAPSNRSAGSDA